MEMTRKKQPVSPCCGKPIRKKSGLEFCPKCGQTLYGKYRDDFEIYTNRDGSIGYRKKSGIKEYEE